MPFAVNVTSIVSAIVSVAGAMIAVFFGLLAHWRHRLSQQAQADREMHEAYNAMVRFRVEHPAVMALSRKWSSDNWNKIYSPQNDPHRQWVVYYSYVELCLHYCNAVLSALDQGLLAKTTFHNVHEPLMRLVLTENDLLIAELAGQPYISNRIKAFREEKAAEGWDWRGEYENLAP